MLDEHGDLEPNQLAQLCLIQSPSLTRMLASMEESGLIARMRSPGDQRRQLVSLTDKCRALLASIEPLVELRYQELESRIGAHRLDQVYRTLDDMLGRV